MAQSPPNNRTTKGYARYCGENGRQVLLVGFVRAWRTDDERKGNEMTRRQLVKATALLAVVFINGATASHAQSWLPLCMDFGETAECSYGGSTAKAAMWGIQSSAHVCVELQNPNGVRVAYADAYDEWSFVSGFADPAATAWTAGSTACKPAPYAYWTVLTMYAGTIIE